MKKSRILLLGISITFLLLSFGITSDEPFIVRLKNLLKNYNSSFPEEKIYVQTDKPFYKPGDDIWFNLFLVNAVDRKPSTLSDVAYVELIDPKGNIAQRNMLQVKQGVARGDFKITEDMVGGLYKLKAYTTWMNNFDDKNIFTKELQVQRILTPHLLMKLDFEKEAYGAGDEVIAKLNVKDLANKPLINGVVTYSLKLAGKNVFQSRQNVTGTDVTIRTRLPEDLNTADGLLQVVVTDKGVTESISRSVPIVFNKISLQFFPEGGDLVLDTESKVAFKALNESGKAADISGEIRDDKNNVVTSFESYHMGMGAFTFTPRSGAKYYAVINKPAGITQHYVLPDAKTLGYTLGVSKQNQGEVRFTVHSPLKEKVYLVGQVGGQIYWADKLNVDNDKTEVAVDTKDFPPGIAVFTLFNAGGQEQCERLVFVNKRKGLDVSLITDKSYYSPREKVEVKIKTADEKGNPVPASLSLAVVDDQLLSFADDKQDNILSWLLMSSELKGDVQEPNFYFNPDEPKADRALDYLLMTQGWRRFTWKEVSHPEQTIAYVPEKIGNLSGYVRNKNTKETARMDVTLLELSNKRRFIDLQTGPDGRFTFYNVDPGAEVLLLSKGIMKNMDNWEIILDKESAMYDVKNNSRISLNTLQDENKYVTLVPEKIKAEVQDETGEPVGEATDKAIALAAGDELNVDMKPDVQSLEEVVVVGYGAERKSSLTSSVVTVEKRELNGEIANPFSTLLQGRVSGIQVTPQSGTPGENVNIRIRGNRTLAYNGEPLYVVDGVPLDNGLNYNFSTSGLLNANDIESITVLSSAEAGSIYGSRGSNGVILINTRRRIGRYWNGYYNALRNRYASLEVKPRDFYRAREFYTPIPGTQNETEDRKDFRSTVYWNPLVITDEKGEAEISFYNTDATTAFRITAEGIGQGKIGRREQVYYTQLPFSMDAKIPANLTFEDTLHIPVLVKNTTNQSIEGAFSVTIPSQLDIIGRPDGTVRVAPQTTETFWVTLTPRSITGTFPLTISLSSKDYHDKIEKEIHVQSTGFPSTASFSAKEIDKQISFQIREPEKGSLSAEFVAYPDVLSDLMAGVESMLREPYGCFEQTSSITFPNILVLQFMKEAGTVNPEIEKKALHLIDKGYKRLEGFEVKGGGFDWFGRPAANEGLTAYGLLEFMEMKKVYDNVNEPMVKRTREWLMDRRKGDGTFMKDSRHYGGDVIDAYVVYALAETGTRDVGKEYTHALKSAIDKNDFYRMALMANAAYELNDRNHYDLLREKFREKVNTSGFDGLTAEKSFTYSFGLSLQVEIVSLWSLAIMKDPACDYAQVEKMMNYLLQHRTNGGFGSTQGTIMALRALTAYARYARKTKQSGTIELYVNNQLAGKRNYTANERGRLTIDDIDNYFIAGRQQVRVVYADTKEPLPYSVNVQWNAKTPASNNDCKIRLSVSLDQHEVHMNETVRLTAHLKNNTEETLPMSMAIIGIPSGLAVQPWQLKELQEKSVFDFYEITDNYLVLYYRGMDPRADQVIKLDLKAEIPGSYLSGASCGYLYYASEFKDWVPGNRIKILE